MARRGISGLGLAVLVLWPAVAAAQDNFWLNDTGGSFGDSGNWSLGVPMPFQSAAFNLHSPGYGVYLDRSYATLGLAVRDDSVYLSLGGFRYDVTDWDGLTIGRDAGESGHLAVSGGILSAYLSTLGQEAGSYGSAIVGSGTIWETLAFFTVGQYGTGHVTIQSGAEAVTTGFSWVASEPGSAGTVVLLWDMNTLPWRAQAYE